MAKNKKNEKKAESGEQISGEKKERVRKKECRKSGETP
jgi:hypothetical protein